MELLKGDGPASTKFLFPIVPADLPDPLKARIIEASIEKGNPLDRGAYSEIIANYNAEASPPEAEAGTEGEEEMEEELLPFEEEFADLMGEAMALPDQPPMPPGGGPMGEAATEDHMVDEPVELEPVDAKIALSSLTEYNRLVKVERNRLIKIVGDVPASYLPRTYLVDLFFKSKIDNVVNLLVKILESSKWLDPKGLKIGIADEKHENLSVQLTIIATAL
jgi:hypothetical protein